MTLLTEAGAASPPDDSQPAPLPPLEIAARALLILSVLLALTAVFFICLNPIAVTDFWWQVKTGELIVRGGAIPTHDPFSWTAPGQRWLVHEWLTEVFFYLAFTYLPGWVLLGYKCGLAVLACALVATRAWNRSGSLALAALGAVAAALVMRNYADLRPQMLTFVLLAALLLALDEYREGRLARLPWALPALFILWANLHGGVVVGLLLLTLWVAGEAVGQRFFDAPKQALGALAAGVAACYPAIAVNPNGVHIYTYPLLVLRHPEVMDYITEWWSPSFHNPDMRAFELLLLLTFGAVALARREGSIRRPGELVVLLAMAHAGLFAQRNTVPFAIAASPAVAAALKSLWREASLTAPRLSNVLGRPAVRAVGAACLAGALAGLSFSYRPPVPPSRWFDYGIRLDSFPRAAARLIGEGFWPGPLYNDYVWGGYLIWKLYPQRKVYIDGRAEVYYPSGAFDDEMKIHGGLHDGLEALDRRGIRVVLTHRFGNLASSLERSPAWLLVFQGDVEKVFVRNDGPRRLPG